MAMKDKMKILVSVAKFSILVAAQQNILLEAVGANQSIYNHRCSPRDPEAEGQTWYIPYVPAVLLPL